MTTFRHDSKLKKGDRFTNIKIGAALKNVNKHYGQKMPSNDLPEDFFNDLFAEQTNLTEGESIRAILKEREESDF